MNDRVELLPPAIAEWKEAIRWYDDQREGLGQEFAQTIDSAIRGIVRSPMMFPRVFGDVRRCLVARFPYGVFYRVLAKERILIVAVFHISRDPSVWQDRS